MGFENCTGRKVHLLLLPRAPEAEKLFSSLATFNLSAEARLEGGQQYIYLNSKLLEPVCSKKRQKIVPDQLLVCRVGDL